MTTTHQRQQKILDCLKKDDVCTILDLAELLSVSTMTIHRDLDKLAEQGAIVKVHGGAMLRLAAPSSNPSSACLMCQQNVRSQLAFVLQFDNNSYFVISCKYE